MRSTAIPAVDEPRPAPAARDTDAGDPTWAGRGATLLPAVLATLVGGYVLLSPRLVDVVMRPGEVQYATVWSLLVALPATVVVVAAVLLGARHPVGGTILLAAPFVAVPSLGWFPYGWLLGFYAIAGLAARRRVRDAAAPALAVLAVATVFAAVDVLGSTPTGAMQAGAPHGFDWPSLVGHTVLLVAVVLVAAAAGAAVRSRALAAAAGDKERRALAVESVAAERARLARDLHDVVAHHVSLVAVRAESAPYQYPDLDDRAREVLAAVAVDARQALGELRHVLAVLRRTGDDPDRAPQPDADDVDVLVAAARDAGQAVDVSGEWGVVPAASGYVLFRVVQECLTNGRRHAPTAAVHVTRWVDPTGAEPSVGLRVTNDVGRPDGPVEPGRGLHGMRERVEAIGGRFAAEVTDGRFVVEVVVPGASR
ncbi:sensor histidine kinase [Cellulomonas fimi]|uniref:histidine kinase n=1 Tax=Cellulomonas fimi (strain ATCC 484 / DSM 20113 / JCM 1341 / CCUG 24087 / LMG 16345 / NBRC 15513 / NCIMB 8980 / NCTC 7547 / NRS-133) TaxID=590998 RepID=F4H310_CELFA|nr:histidine kinase [Cellulomonas fimi]AEE47628.1 integral membrane sensor signal transduction histidine kinase [Cellulomonas fimi ATCC 484]NNH08621.1 two-component sensor histidine kinase [Cellulomonas fimi]VEH36676.1 Nitrate/nitrite sensor protein narX [Cellulomonas fimi]